MNGFFKDRVLLEQSFAKDEKQTIADLLGEADGALRTGRGRGLMSCPRWLRAPLPGSTSPAPASPVGGQDVR